jgi:hypothetical protein
MSISNSKIKNNYYNMNTKTRKRRSKIGGGIFDKYEKVYKNTPYIPKSTFISNMILKFPDFYKKYKENSLLIVFNNIFDIDFKPKDTRKFTINKQPLKPSTFYTLDKIIEYAIFITSKSFFISHDNKFYPTNHIIDDLKHQIGKDVLRSTISINGTNYDASKTTQIDNFTQPLSEPSSTPSGITSDQPSDNFIGITDTFYETIITYFKTNNLPINFNQINKIALLCCQNISNFLSDLTVLYLNDILKPDICVVYQADRNIKIDITKSAILLTIVFQSKLIISDDEMLDPEIQCGNLFIKTKFDILNNTFVITKFTVNINKITCNVSEIKDKESPLTNITLDKSMLPVGVSAVGIATSPFILGAI